MTKPTWDEVPAWANFIAQDLDGEWTAYEKKPIKLSLCHWSLRNGRFEVVGDGPYNPDWEDTCEGRPGRPC